MLVMNPGSLFYTIPKIIFSQLFNLQINVFIGPNVSHMHRSRICGAPTVSPVTFATCGLWRSNTHETAMGYDAVLGPVFFSFLAVLRYLHDLNRLSNQPNLDLTNKSLQSYRFYKNLKLQHSKKLVHDEISDSETFVSN
jgi:hypothetical protein